MENSKMTKDFETWLSHNEKALDFDAYGLFCDSLKCYKNDIDRPSYLLAYQGMLTQVRTSIVNSKCPEGYIAGEWTSIVDRVMQPNKWDENVYDCIQQKEKPIAGGVKPPIIIIDESVRNAMPYWRDLRNVCAHYKDAVFSKAHTLTLYAFIQQNLLSMTVKGGYTILMQEFKDYYLPSKVNRDVTPIEPLLDKIIVMTLPNERLRFIEEIVSYVHSEFLGDEHNILMMKLWRHSSELRDLVRLYFNKNKGVRLDFINMFPELVLQLYEKEDIHELWFMYIPKMDNGCAVLAELLNAGLIPDGEKDKIPLHILERKFASDKVAGELTAMQVAILQSIHYFDIFMSKYMDSDYTGAYPNYSILNSKLRFYISHLHYVNFRIPDNAKRIYEVFSHHNCAYLLVSDFIYYLNQNHDEYVALRDTLATMGLAMPDKIKIDESTL